MRVGMRLVVGLERSAPHPQFCIFFLGTLGNDHNKDVGVGLKLYSRWC